MDDLNRDERMAALFANMVLQQTNLAFVFLGKVPHPETKQTMKDLEAARMFIDQLEMLEAKTKGNLNKEEAALLKESLMSLRLTFVQAVEKGETAPAPEQPESSGRAAGLSPDTAQSKPTDTQAPAADDESKKKFVKKY
jgi:uncharacterized protein DUF1844